MEAVTKRAVSAYDVSEIHKIFFVSIYEVPYV